MPTGPKIGFVRKDVEVALPKWELVDDAIEGGDRVKNNKHIPLLSPSGNTQRDKTRNESYVKGAVFYPVTSRTRDGLVGQVFSKKIDTDLPSTLEFMVDDIDGSGNSLEQQSKKTLSSVVEKGRAGLLSDFPRVPKGEVVTQADIDNGKFRPNVILYQPSQIINWREISVGGVKMLSKVILKEMTIVDDDGYEFKTEPRWREYRINDGMQVTVTVWKIDPENKEEYLQDKPESFVTGSDQQPLKSIPFTFVGALNNDSEIDDAPLYPLATLNIAHLVDSATNQQALAYSSPVLLLTGVTQEWKNRNFKGGVSMASDNGIVLDKGAAGEILQARVESAISEAMVKKEDQMKSIGAKLIEPSTVQRTATEAEIEATSEASILSSVAKNVSEAYEIALMHCSWFIAPVEIDEITVTLNSEFQVAGLNAQERKEVVEAWGAGVLAKSEVREVFRKKGIATLTDEEAQVLIDGENRAV